MFCPRCSQQHLYDEVRFCSRCGFQLLAVSQLLRNDGAAYMRSEAKDRLPLIKRKELRSGAKLVFASFFLTIPCLILTGISDNPLPLLLIPITFLLGLAQILYYFFFGESILPIKKQKQSFESNEYQHQLNYQPAQRLPFSAVDSKSFNTVEFPQYRGATKRTTNLYDS